VHVLVIAIGFPSPVNPYAHVFIGEQVRILCEYVERVTVLSPSPSIPAFLSGIPRYAKKISLPTRYWMIPDRCEVLFPRYLKAPGHLFFAWTTAQWCRIVSNAIAELNKYRPVSIVHANAGSVSAWAAIQAARRYEIPSVVTYQGSEVHTTLENRQKGWKLCRDSFRFAGLNISVSRSLENILMKHARPQGRYEVLLRGVDQIKFFPPTEGERKPIVLFVGRIGASKGIFDLLAAWEQVVGTCPHAELWIVGPDHTDGHLIREIRSRGYDCRIKLIGPLPSHDVANLMRTAQVLCLPSHGEGTPNCVMEALACGLPVVATRVGGIPDVIEDQKSGILVDKGDIQGLADALVCLLQDSHARTRMGETGHAFARRHLDARINVIRLVHLYEELIASHLVKKSNIAKKPRFKFSDCLGREP